MGYGTCHRKSIICFGEKEISPKVLKNTPRELTISFGVIDVVDNFFNTRIGYITQMLRLCSKNVKGLDNPVKVITFARK